MGADNRKGVLYAAITASLWGFLAIAIKVAVYDLSPVSVVWFRFFSAFIMLSIWTFIFRKGDFRIFLKPPFLLILTAIFLSLNYLGFISGIKYISPSSSQIFIQIAPVSFALSGIFIFKESVNWKHITGFLLVVSGIAVFYSEQISELVGTEDNFTRGMLLVIGGGLAWTVFATLQKRLIAKYSTNQLNLFIYGFAALLLAPLTQFSRLLEMNMGSWFLLIFLGLNTLLAYGSLALAIKYTEATRVSVIITLNPIITFTVMAILTHMEVGWIEPESFSYLSFIGASTVLFGAFMVISAGWKKRNSG